ncbi:MAG: hypothetical protein GF417_08390 [Candidatus Latescibacteria bacterium]|nr:hypothetical protein [bacterium]MBD3424440.1 hypothetical protein [Candidatus Latescibacterota bacterium]
MSSVPDITHSLVQGGYSGTGNIDQDPIWMTGPEGNYYLSETLCGQASDIPCVKAGSAAAESLGVVDRITTTDHGPDTGMVDIGYHY